MIEAGHSETVQFDYDAADMADVRATAEAVSHLGHPQRACSAGIAGGMLSVAALALAQLTRIDPDPFLPMATLLWIVLAIGITGMLLEFVLWPRRQRRRLRREVERDWTPDGLHTCVVTRDDVGVACRQPGLTLQIPYDEVLDVSFAGPDLEITGFYGDFVNIRARAFESDEHAQRFAEAVQQAAAAAQAPDDEPEPPLPRP